MSTTSDLCQAVELNGETLIKLTRRIERLERRDTQEVEKLAFRVRELERDIAYMIANGSPSRHGPLDAMRFDGEGHLDRGLRNHQQRRTL